MTCSPGQFSCSDGTCLDATRLCDGRKDCPDAEDEDANNCHSVAVATTLLPAPLTPTTPSLGTGMADLFRPLLGAGSRLGICTLGFARGSIQTSRFGVAPRLRLVDLPLTTRPQEADHT